MHKNATKCHETIYKWCKNKHGASKIIDTFETYQGGTEEKAWAAPAMMEKGWSARGMELVSEFFLHVYFFLSRDTTR
jgi:hypothetical protein